MTLGASLAGKKFLIAEDNFLVAEELRYALEEAGGIVVRTVSDAQGLSQLIDVASFDCAVLDIQLRNGNSIGVARHLQRRNVPFVILTGYTQEWLPNELRMAPYAAKPIDRQALIDLIARVVH